MENETRTGANGAGEDVRSDGVPRAGNGAPPAQGVPGGDTLAMPRALEGLNARERAIFNAGMAAGAAQQLAQIAGQHSVFLGAAKDQMTKRQEQALKMLSSLPPGEPVATTGALAGAEAARRVVAAGKALLGRK